MPPSPSLPQGAVFYMRHRKISSRHPHYLVVLNANAKTDDLIVLSVITSQIEKRKKQAALRNFPPESLVEFSPKDYWPLDKPSLIDCNACITTPGKEFRQNILTETRCANLPKELLGRILDGVRASKKTSDEIKKRLGLSV